MSQCVFGASAQAALTAVRVAALRRRAADNGANELPAECAAQRRETRCRRLIDSFDGLQDFFVSKGLEEIYVERQFVGSLVAAQQHPIGSQ